MWTLEKFFRRSVGFQCDSRDVAVGDFASIAVTAFEVGFALCPPALPCPALLSLLSVEGRKEGRKEASRVEMEKLGSSCIISFQVFSSFLLPFSAVCLSASTPSPCALSLVRRLLLGSVVFSQVCL